MKKTFPCPLCGKPLLEREYLDITGRWEQLRGLETKFKQQLKDGVDSARRTERARVSRDFVLKEKTIVALRGQLARLKAQTERGLSPQQAGLLYEKELARQLAQQFRQDQIVGAGKGGDVLHHIRMNGRRIGTLVYECKDVNKLLRAHVEQARRAMIQREAEYAVLVTPARVANSFGFWVEKDVLVIHPAGVLMLAAWLREALCELARARLPKSARERAARDILGFIASPSFRNSVQDAVRRTEALGEQLKDEVRAHWTFWERRLEHYRSIWIDARTVALGAAGVLERRLVRSKRVLPEMEVREYPVDKAKLLPASKERLN